MPTAQSQGRPTVYTEAIAEEILLRMADGETLRSICRDDHLPAESTVRHWAVEDREGFFARYAKARKIQADYWADEIIDIADDASRDVFEVDGKESINREYIQRSRLRVDTRKWLMSKLYPGRYGDLTKLEHSGPGGLPLEGITVTLVRPDDAEGTA